MNDDDSRNKPTHDRAGHPLAADAPFDAAPDDPRGEPIFTDASKNPWIVEDSTDTEDEYHVADAEQSGTAQEQELFEDGDGEEGLADDEPDYDWDDQESYADGPAGFESELPERTYSSPLGLVIVGLVVLVLLAAGGYGVIQQRSAAAQDEISQLQAALATAASPAEVTATREALREMEQQTEKHLAVIEVLTLNNKRLTDTVAGLEKQLAVQQAEAPRSSQPGQSAAAEPASKASASKPSTASTVTETTPNTAGADRNTNGGDADWFVNFSSYSLRSTAEKWVTKLSPSAGNAVVLPTTKDGKTLYRVRILGLSDRAQAEKVAGQLQSAYKLPPLWVGQE